MRTRRTGARRWRRPRISHVDSYGTVRRASLWGVLLVSVILCSSCGTGGDQEQPRAEASGGARPGARETAAVEARAEASERASSGGLEAHIDASRQKVEGGFDEVRLEAELIGEGRARARFEGARGVLMTATIDGPRRGVLEWKGIAIDGMGARTVAELEALADLEGSLPARALALIALDLACEPGAENLDPAVGAALLLPWQMLLKYADSGGELAPRKLALESECQHFRGPLDERDSTRTPSPTVVALTYEQPIPMAGGYFPFDGEGQVE